MSTHTVVIEYPEGVNQSYHADMDALSGKVVAVNFSGNRLVVEEMLLEALEAIVKHYGVTTFMQDAEPFNSARAAIKAATGVTR